MFSRRPHLRSGGDDLQDRFPQKRVNGDTLSFGLSLEGGLLLQCQWYWNRDIVAGAPTRILPYRRPHLSKLRKHVRTFRNRR